MTYGQGLKLLRQIHADLTHRADRGQTLVGARICIATHYPSGLMDAVYGACDVHVHL